MDIDIGVVVKTGLEGKERNGLRLFLIYLADDFADLGLTLAWNTEYDWTCDPKTPGVAKHRFRVSVCGAARQKAALEAFVELELANFVRSGMVPHMSSFDIEEIALGINHSQCSEYNR